MRRASRSLLARLFNSRGGQKIFSMSAELLANRTFECGDGGNLSKFRENLGQLKSGTVLELGTRRVEGNPPTVRRDWVPDGVRYIGCDYQSGFDVDEVVDAEKLSETFASGSIDAVIACSVFEHIRKPWIAAQEISKVLRRGGWAFVQTHQTFPIHAYPYDYWRFSREAMETLFSAECGFCNQVSWYDFPASILSARVPSSVVHPAFLNVNIIAERC